MNPSPQGSLLDRAWTLSPNVALRPEPFGALAYHFGNRRLTFLRRPELVAVVRGLSEHRDLRSALQDAQVPKTQWPAYEQAIAGLVDSDMVRRRDPAPRGDA